MENQRLLLFLALSLVTLLLWEAWQSDHAPAPIPQVATPSQQPVTPASPGSDVPAQAGSTEALPAVADVPTEQAPTGVVPADVVAATGLKTGERVTIKTDLLDVELDTMGGDIRIVQLLNYPVSSKDPDQPFDLFTDQHSPLFVAQSGLLSSLHAPDHYETFSVENRAYALAPGEDELRVPMTWTSDTGVSVTKTLIFHRGEYVVDVEQTVTNRSGQPWSGRQYRQLQRSSIETGGSAFIYTYTGGVIFSDQEKYEKIEFDDMASQDLGRNITGGWAAMIQHYFVGAWIPDQGEQNFFYSKAPGQDRFVLGLVSPEKSVADGESVTFHSRLFVGPKLQDKLEVLAPGLELTVDYGFLTVIAKPLFWLLQFSHDLVGNWGWAIAMVTLVIKLVFYPLSAASYRSMANMRRLQPKMVALRERYGDDRQRMSQAMMELYKKEKINPFGGCLPILVQIPVFIALYWVLLESVELRQAPFILWIQDLSSKDPYYVLPLLMGASMFIQQKLHPPPPDPVQAKVMMALPIIFTLFFAFFPSGLVLYWVVNNILSIAQQWYITKKVEQASKPVKA